MKILRAGLLFVEIGVLFWCIGSYLQMKWSMGCLHDAVEVYDICTLRVRATSSPQEMVDILVYVYMYYPPGTRGDTSNITEPVAVICKRMACENIIEYIAHKTNEVEKDKQSNYDLAIRIEYWVQKYGNYETQRNFKSFRTYEQENYKK